MDRKKNIRKKMDKKGIFCGAAMLMGILLFSACDNGGMQTEKETMEAVDFFTYTEEGNRLYLWKQGAEEAVLLTDCAFAQGGEAGSVEEGKERAENGAEWKYWEEWEYWQEWDERDKRWVRNDEKALEAVVKEGPDHSLYFPQRMRWENFGIEKSAAEQEEEAKYAIDREVDAYVGIKIFLYDLYRYDESIWTEEVGEAEKIAGNVLFYHVDKAGHVWYCQAVGNGIRRMNGEERTMIRCMLYRYDGEEHLEIAEIDGSKNGAFLVRDDGQYVIFYGPDDGLYGAKPREDAVLLAKKVDASYHMGSGFYTDADMEDVIYRGDNAICLVLDRKKENEMQLADTENLLFAGLIGEGEKRIFLLEEIGEGEQTYADWILREEEKEDADTKRLWELMEQVSSDLYPFLCRASVMDYASSQIECIWQMDGYVLSCPTFNGIENPKKVYYLEMIPADSFQKFTLSELLGENTPADVLQAYEYCKEDYDEGEERRAISEALRSCWDYEAIRQRGEAYAATADDICWLEEAGSGSWPTLSDYGASGDVLFPLSHVDVGLEWTYSNYSSRFYYGYREDRYALDGEGNCRKIVEAADETVVSGDEVFYSRDSGLEGAVSLYRAGMEGCIAEMVSISMESIKKSTISDAVLFLTGGLLPEEEEQEIHLRSREELKAVYDEAAKDMGDDEEAGRTLALCDGDGVRELEKQVRQYGFYGTDSVWMRQYEEKQEEEAHDSLEELEEWEEEAGAWSNGRDCGRLQVYEEGKKKQIAEHAVWVIEPVSASGTGEPVVMRTVCVAF